MNRLKSRKLFAFGVSIVSAFLVNVAGLPDGVAARITEVIEVVGTAMIGGQSIVDGIANWKGRPAG